MRAVCIGARTDHVSLSGDHTSGSRPAPNASPTLELRDPPIASTVPSGRTVRLCSVRGNPIEAAGCQVGDGNVMSRTYAVATEGTPSRSGSRPSPVLMIFPGAYIAALPPSRMAGSTVLQVWVARLSTTVAIARRFDEVARTRPSGSTNMGGEGGK